MSDREQRNAEALNAWSTKARAHKKKAEQASAQSAAPPAPEEQYDKGMRDIRIPVLIYAGLNNLALNLLPPWLAEYGLRTGIIAEDTSAAVPHCTLTYRATLRLAQLGAARREGLYLRGSVIYEQHAAGKIRMLEPGIVALESASWLMDRGLRGRVEKEIRKACSRHYDRAIARAAAYLAEEIG